MSPPPAPRLSSRACRGISLSGFAVGGRVRSFDCASLRSAPLRMTGKGAVSAFFPKKIFQAKRSFFQMHLDSIVNLFYNIVNNFHVGAFCRSSGGRKRPCPRAAPNKRAPQSGHQAKKCQSCFSVKNRRQTSFAAHPFNSFGIKNRRRGRLWAARRKREEK